jgi:hypothetical protein
MSSSVQEDSGALQLQAKLPQWCALRWQHAVICFTFLVLFLHLCYLPLPTGQIWHEVANGRAIVNSGIAASDPAVVYAEGIRGLRTNWLGQAFVYWTYHVGGPEWLSCMFALVQLVTLAIWGFIFRQVSGRRWTVLLAVAIVLASSMDVNALGSSTFGLLMFALIALTVINKFESKSELAEASEFCWSDASIWQWVVVVGLFAVWSNIDISVLIGVGLLGVIAVSRLIGVLAQRPGHGTILADRELHHRTWLFEICLAATLLQPHGLEMWQAVFWSANNPIVHAFGGWSPVAIAGWRGLWIAVAWLGWIAASRQTNSVPLWNIASAILVTLIVACFQSQIVWFATTMCFLGVALLPKLVALGGAADPAIEKEPVTEGNPSLKFAFTLVCGLFVWMGFSLSPIGTMAMSGTPRTPAQLFGGNTPLGATEFLKESRPEKTVWTPKYWADHLQVAGAPIPVMANLNDALLTPRIEKDYQSIYYGGKNWQRLLRRYQIDDLVVDKENQTELVREIRNSGGAMKKVFEDQISVIYRRIGRPAGSKSRLQQPRLQKSKLEVAQPSKARSKNVAFEKPESSQAQAPDPPGAPHPPKASHSQERFAQGANETDLSESEREPAAVKLFDDRSKNTTSIFGD